MTYLKAISYYPYFLIDRSLHTVFPSMCHGLPAKDPWEEHHPTWREPDFTLYSSVTLETGDNWAPVAGFAASCPNLHRASETWHILVWETVDLVITNHRRHPAVCQKWRLRREKCPWYMQLDKSSSQWRRDTGSLALSFGLKNCFHFVNGFVPFLQFFHYFLV